MIDFKKASFKDFEDNEGLDFMARAALWDDYVTSKVQTGEWHYRKHSGTPF